MRPVVILLVEDEPVIALDMQHRLEREGCVVWSTDQTEEAISLCARNRPDLALVNFQQTGIADGMALAQCLRTRFGLPVALVTGARPQELTASAAFSAGYRVLYKPFTQRQLTAFLWEDIKGHN